MKFDADVGNDETRHRECAKETGLRFVCGSGLKLSVFTGADYVVVSINRRSVSDVAVVLGDTAISWKTSTQKCMTTAACEA